MFTALVLVAFVSPRLDAEGVPLPREAMHRVGSARWRYAGWQSAPVVSADGSLVFTHTEDESVLVWEAATGRILDRIAVPSLPTLANRDIAKSANPFTRPPLHPDFAVATQRRIELHHDGTLRIIDFAYGNLWVRTLNPATRELTTFLRMDIPLGQTVQLTADGKRVASHIIDVTRNVSIDTERHSFKVFDTTTKKLLYDVPIGNRLHTYGFSPDGSRLAVSDVDTLRLFDGATGQPMRTLHTTAGRPVRVLAIAPDGATVVGRVLEHDGKESTTIWQPDGTAVTTEYLGHRYGGTGLVFRPNGRQLAVNTGIDSWKFLDPSTGRVISSLTVPRTLQLGVAFAPDGQRMYISGFGYVEEKQPFSGTRNAGFLLPIDVTAHPPRPAFEVRPNRYYGTFAANGDYVAVQSATITRWHATTGRANESKLPIDVKQEYPNLAFSRDGNRFALVVPPSQDGKRPGRLELVDLVSNQQTTLDTRKDGIGSPVFAPDDRTLYANVGPGVTGWTLATGKSESRPWPKYGLRPNSFAAHYFDGRWMWSSPINFADSATPPPVEPFLVRDWNDPNGAAWAIRAMDYGTLPLVFPDGRAAVVSTKASALELWERDSGRRRWWTPTEAYSWTLSPDERTLAGMTGSGTIELVEVASGRVRHRFVGHHGRAENPRFSPDGRLLATIGADAPIFLWDIRGELAKPKSPPDLQQAWADLASLDAPTAFRAIRTLAWFPEQSLPLLRENLPPIPALAEGKLTKLIAALDVPAFADREAAMKELKSLGELAVPQLEATLKQTESVEARTRIEKLLEANFARPRDGEYLRAMRAVEAVEWMGTAAAKTLLETWASGAAGARLTSEAKAAAGRP